MMYSALFNDLQATADFQYVEPRTVKEACALLALHKEKAALIAGGTELLESIRSKAIAPEFVINLKSIPNLDAITYDATEGLKIGALATLEAIESSPLVKEKCAVLPQTIHDGAVQARWQYYMATLGGRLCHRTPPTDLAPVLIALDARVTLEGVKGWRALPIEQFFMAGKTVLTESYEILSAIRVPNLPLNSGAACMKHAATGNLPGLNVAVLLSLDQKKVNISNMRLAIGIAGRTILRATGAESLIKGKPIGEDIVKQASQAAAAESVTISGAMNADAFQKSAAGLVEQAIMHVIDDAIGDFAMGY